MIALRIFVITTTLITCYGSEDNDVGGGIGIVSSQSIEDTVVLDSSTSTSNTKTAETEIDTSGESSSSTASTKNNNVPTPAHIWGTNNNFNNENEYNASGTTNSPLGNNAETGLPYLSRQRSGNNISLGSKIANNDDNPKDKSIPLEHIPPTHFKIKARLLSNPTTGHSYFEEEPKEQVQDDKEDIKNHLLLPFTDCSKAGISTPPISIRHATFRHLPPHGSTPSFSPSPHPQLIVCLYPLQITTSNGESRSFDAGDVIWMDDIHGKGHQMTTVDIGEDHWSVLILSLKDHVHSSSSTPCPNDLLIPPSSDTVNIVPSLRKLVLGTIGVGLSSALTYFLAKVAPHVLAVGVGGVCMIAGGTSSIVFGGEKLIDTVQEALLQYRTNKLLLDENEEDDDVVESTTMDE